MSTVKANALRHLDNALTDPNVQLQVDGDVYYPFDLSVRVATVRDRVEVANGVICDKLTSNTLDEAPLVVQSSIKVANLNVSQLEGYVTGSVADSIPLLGNVAGKVPTGILGKTIPPGELVDQDSTQTLTNKTVGGPLAVKGNLTVATDDPATTANITCDGDIIAFNTSDLRLKKNLRDISRNPLNDLARLEGIRFEWLEEAPDGGSQTSVGVIAQQVRDVLPEAVTERSNGMLAVRYELLIPLLLEGIKQLDTRVAELEEQLHGEF